MRIIGGRRIAAELRKTVALDAVIDVGTGRVVDGDGTVRIVGEVCFNEMAHVGAITPVPGRVGPMTVACLLANTG